MKRFAMILALVGLPALTARVAAVKPPAGINVVDWKQIKAEYQRHRHAFFPAAEGGYTARAWEQQWLATFDGRGFAVKPKEGAFEWGLELTSYGRAGREIAVKAGKPTANVERFSYHYSGALTEWFINEEHGLEHGFTLRERPAGAGEMMVTLRVRGGLKPRVSGNLVELVDGAGTERMKYSALTVVDARGLKVPARFATQESMVQIVIDDAAAQYPVTVDPIAQQAYLKASNTGAFDQFGSSVAASGDTVVVGAPGEDSYAIVVNGTPNENAIDSGAAYVFVRRGTDWSQQAFLKASNTGVNDRFGASVAISGDTVIVGAYYEDTIENVPNAPIGSGAAYVFVRNGSNWSQQAYLKASNERRGDEFGWSIALSGDTAVVGARRESSSTTGVNSRPDTAASWAGAAYIFVRNGTTWSQQAYLKPSNTRHDNEFGWSAALSGDTVVVGMPAEYSSSTGINSTPDTAAPGSGAVYVFVRNGTTWSQQAYLKPSKAGVGSFGSSVTASGNTVAVGSSSGLNNDGTSFPMGAVHIFVRSGTNWSQQAYLTSYITEYSNGFGGSVGLTGDLLAVGAAGERAPNGVLNSGAVHIFARNGNTWSQIAHQTVVAGQGFGYPLAVSGDTILAGATGDDFASTGINSTPGGVAYSSGAAYIFRDDTAPAGSHFIPIEPCRAADTRNPGSSQMPRDSFRNFTFAACSIPFDATAIALNVTLVPSGQFGFLSIWPAGQAQPTVSTMNSLDGRIKANAAIVGLGAGQAVSVYVTDPAHVILDVNGYFVPIGTPGALAYYPVAPCRVVDTRNTGGIIAAKSTRIISGGCLPANAQAYSLNVTVVPPAPLGFLTLWPTGATQPITSTLNNLKGTVVANAAILRSGAVGAFNAYVTDASHFIADLNGYFAPPGSPGALAFYPSTPCRIFDTRNANGAFGGPAMAWDNSRSFTVPSSGCGIPSSAQAYVTNATVVPSAGFGFLTLWPGGQARPTVSVLNAVDGAITSNAAIVPAGPGGVIQAYTSDATHLLLDISGYFAP